MINAMTVTIWGSGFVLPVIYDCYSDMSITENQIMAIEEFSKHLEWIELSKNNVVEYCKVKVMDDTENHKKDNIFSYIKPERLFVKHEEGIPRIALMCKYRYDIEHGLAIVFSDKGEITVGSQDIIL